MRILAEEAIAELPSSISTMTTPCGTFEGTHIDTDNLCAVSIIRSGDALLEAVRECLPSVAVGKILIQRNEKSKDKEAVLYYSKMPPGVEDMNVLLCDPMLATGGSAKAAIDCLIHKYNVKKERIIFANMITCPEGLNRMAEWYPEIKIITAVVDDHLNEEKYIVPGLGDYGDRFFNTL
jgi:uracil phosphoribosyltransferase